MLCFMHRVTTTLCNDGMDAYIRYVMMVRTLCNDGTDAIMLYRPIIKTY